MDYTAYTTYTTSYSSSDIAVASTLGGIIQTFGTIMLILGILLIIAQWRIFTKAGEAGWKSLIPIYNMVTLYKIIGLSPALLLVYLLGIIPVIGAIAAFALSVVTVIKLGKAFGKSNAFIVGLFLLSPIFQLILGFGNSQYMGPQKNM